MALEVYHGSNLVIDAPKLIPNQKKSLDFGTGFYVTTVFDMAVKRADSKFKELGYGGKFVSKYNFYWDDLLDNGLKMLQFKGYSEEWFDFVCDCRQVRYAGDYDIIIGNIADDDTLSVIKAYEAGFYNNYKNGDPKTLAINDLLLIKGAQVVNYNQICFKTARSFKYLEFFGV